MSGVVYILEHEVCGHAAAGGVERADVEVVAAVMREAGYNRFRIVEVERDAAGVVQKVADRLASCCGTCRVDGTRALLVSAQTRDAFLMLLPSARLL